MVGNVGNIRRANEFYSFKPSFRDVMSVDWFV